MTDPPRHPVDYSFNVISFHYIVFVAIGSMLKGEYGFEETPGFGS